MPNASQLVRTAAPIRLVSPPSMTWQIAPPVSLPTIIDVAEAERGDEVPDELGDPAQARGPRPAFIGHWWAPSGSVGA